MDIKKVKGYYGRLKGIQNLLASANIISIDIKNDFNNIIEGLSEELDEDLKHLKSDAQVTGHFFDKDTCQPLYIKEKLTQAINYLEYTYNLGEQIIEIGSIYNSIKDEVLKARCTDLLSAPGDFDRVINQATQVLEDRIRNVSKNDDNLTAVKLVNQVISSDISKSKLELSSSKREHEGLFHIIRGVMSAYRNPTHHVLTDKYSREEALIVCAFIDLLLEVINNAKLKK
jgi:hypothetical protein